MPQTDNGSMQVHRLMRVERKLHEFEKRNQKEGRQRQSQALNEKKVLEPTDNRRAHMRARGEPEEEVSAAKYQDQERAFRHSTYNAQEGDCDRQNNVGG